jgi:mannose-6-phosphate isomerase-like protein (cupin superfamily)
LVPDATAPDGSAIYFRVVDAKSVSLVEVVLEPGMVSRPVHHRTVEEIWYFLAGGGQVWMRSPDRETERTQRVAPGSAVTIPTGWDFQFSAEADAALRFLCFTSPPWPGVDEAVPVADGGLGRPTV